MSAIETTDGRAQDVARPVATIHPLPSRATPDLAPLPIPTRAQIAALVTPPDIWSDDRPSLRKVLLYGRYGRWTDASGPFRVAGTIYAAIAGAVTGVLYLVAWVVERPSRVAVAATVAGLVKLALS